jgi:hypothetical protein
LALLDTAEGFQIVIGHRDILCEHEFAARGPDEVALYVRNTLLRLIPEVKDLLDLGDPVEEFGGELAAFFEDKVAVRHLVSSREHSAALLWASPAVRDDKDVALTAVAACGLALQYVSERLSDDIDVVMTAVRTWGSSLRYASARLRSNPEVVMAALCRDWTCVSEEDGALLDNLAWSSLTFAEPDLMHDFTFLSALFKSFPYLTRRILNCVPRWVAAELPFARELLREFPFALPHAPLRIRRNISLVRVALQSPGQNWASKKLRALALAGAASRLRRMGNIVYLAVTHNGLTLKYASKKLRSCPKIVVAAIKNDVRAVCYVPMKERSLDGLLASFKYDASVRRYMLRLKSRRRIRKAAASCHRLSDWNSFWRP